MITFVIAVHVVLCVILILIILLQPGKGSDVGAAFGGGATTSVFGPRGPGSLLSRATTFVAVGFMVTSITLALSSDRQAGGGVNIDEDLFDENLEQSDWAWDANLDEPPPTLEEAAPPNPGLDVAPEQPDTVDPLLPQVPPAEPEPPDGADGG